MTPARILIVDNDVRFASMLAELLAAEDFQTEYASNRAAALDCFTRPSFDLLILDAMAPRMEGLNLLRWVRKEASIPVLMLTSAGDENTGFWRWNQSGLPLLPDFPQTHPEQSVCWSKIGTANASLEDCQLLAESEILQRDLFIAAKDQRDHPK